MPIFYREAYELPLISAVSPSLAEALRACPLQAGISRIDAVRDHVLGNPKAWLGTAYHKVLEQVIRLDALSGEAAIDDLWMRAIGVLKSQAEAHPLNRRFAVPEQWPGYYLVHAFAVLRAKQALQSRAAGAMFPARADSVFREQQFTAMGGRLVGKPDVICGRQVRDYKSGRIYDQGASGDPIVKQAYVRQLRLYGRLVQENLDSCPSSGVLLPMDGEAVEIALDPEACAAEATEAVRLLEQYNDKVQTSVTVAELATPSPSSCRWCQYKALCPAFWEVINETWIEGLGYAHVRGPLSSTPRTIHNDRAFSISLTSTAGTTTGLLTIAPLEASIHGTVASLQAGDVVRVTNLYRRNDGQLAPTATTVCTRESDCVLFSTHESPRRSASS